LQPHQFDFLALDCRIKESNSKKRKMKWKRNK
jgi:hypothetical protein